MSAPIKRYDALGDIDGGYLKAAADGRVVLHSDHIASHAFDEAKERELFEAVFCTFDHAGSYDGRWRYADCLVDYLWFGWLGCARSRAERFAGGAE